MKNNNKHNNNDDDTDNNIDSIYAYMMYRHIYIYMYI